MAGSLAHILDIAGADALLACGHPFSGRNLRPCKIRFQRSHAGIDQQQALVIMRNQRKALHGQMALTFKKLQKHLSKLVYSIWFHLFPPEARLWKILGLYNLL